MRLGLRDEGAEMPQMYAARGRWWCEFEVLAVRETVMTGIYMHAREQQKTNTLQTAAGNFEPARRLILDRTDFR